MLFYLNNQNGTGYCYTNEELTKDGATYIDVRSDTNVS